MSIRSAVYHIRETLDPFDVDEPADQIPELPYDVTELDSSGLMVLFTALSAWCEYADVILARAATVEKEAELEVTRAGGRAASNSGERTVTARRLEASLNTAVQNAENEQMAAYNARKRAEAAVKLAERRFAVVSREITRRGAAPRGRGE